jgi:quercetin dioxygenase-like cupin family protein
MSAKGGPVTSKYFPLSSFPALPGPDGCPSRRLLSFGGSLMLAEMSFDAGAASAVHAHPEEQLSYCLSGEFETEVGGEKARLGPGDSFYAGPGEPHGAICLAAGRLLHVFTPQREDYKQAGTRAPASS